MKEEDEGLVSFRKGALRSYQSCGSVAQLPRELCYNFWRKKRNMPKGMFLRGAPTEIRTPVLALKGLRPGPLDDGGVF